MLHALRIRESCEVPMCQNKRHLNAFNMSCDFSSRTDVAIYSLARDFYLYNTTSSVFVCKITAIF